MMGDTREAYERLRDRLKQNGYQTQQAERIAREQAEKHDRKNK